MRGRGEHPSDNRGADFLTSAARRPKPFPTYADGEGQAVCGRGGGMVAGRARELRLPSGISSKNSSLECVAVLAATIDIVIRLDFGPRPFS